MILKELANLYERLLKQGVLLPRMGEIVQRVSFVIRLTPEGALSEYNPIERIGELNDKGKMEPIPMLVLCHEKTNSIEPGFLCDKLENIFGVSSSKNEKFDKKGERKLSQAEKYYKSSVSLYSKVLADYPFLISEGVSAISTFLKSLNLDEAQKTLIENGVSTDDLSAYAVFQICGKTHYVHENPIIKNWWNNEGEVYWYDMEEIKMQCLVSGIYTSISKTHTPRITKVSENLATLVSYNSISSESYGKNQSENAPVSTSIVHGYCNSLNYLLSRKENHIKLAGATAVFWTDAPAETACDYESLIGGFLLTERNDAQDEPLSKRVNSVLKDIFKGSLPNDMLQTNTRFFILVLSPNNARLSVRFYEEGFISKLIELIADHYAALSLDCQSFKLINRTRMVTPSRILCSSVRYDKDYAKLVLKVPPLYEGLIMKSILKGEAYPSSLAFDIMRRFGTEGMTFEIKEKEDIKKCENTYTRCAFIKAWLTRKKSNYKIKPMLDEDNNQPGYVLGRLFALLQKTQSDTHPNLNRTIQDAFYSSASVTPVVVFPRLLKLYRHHIAKLTNVGRRIAREKQVQRVMSKLEKFPVRLSSEQQGFFALGFYHQIQDFFTSTEDNN